jgi:hypothetical protein
MRNALLVVTLGFLSAAAACDGSTQAGSGSGGAGADGGSPGSGGAFPGTGGAGQGGASGTGGSGRGGASGTGGAAGAGASGAGGAAVPTNYGNCRNGLACSAGQTCAFDCQGNSGSATLSGAPAIRCSCVNGAFACTLMYEGTAGAPPPTCSGVIVFGQCSSACRICAAAGSGAGCFCDMGGSWICTS